MNPVNVTVFEGVEDWRKARRGSLGASEIPSLFGFGYSSPLELWVDKSAELSNTETSAPEGEKPLNVRYEMGHAAEPVLARVAERDLGSPVLRLDPPVIYRTDAIPRVHASPDALLLDERPQRVRREALHKRAKAIVSFKTAAFDSDDWPENDPHPYALIQLQTEMLLTGIHSGHVTALFGLGTTRTMPAKFHESFGEEIVERAARFWENVTNGTPPAPTGTAADERALKALFRRSEPTRIFLSREWGQKLAERESLKTQIADLETRVATIDQEAKLALGDAELGIVPDFPKAIKWATEYRTFNPTPARTIESRPLRIVNTPKPQKADS